jgi:hypothetical protein
MSTSSPPFVRHLIRNLRVSIFVLLVAILLLFLYSLISGGETNWQLGAFVALGMVLSSIVNAFYDARKESDV